MLSQAHSPQGAQAPASWAQCIGHTRPLHPLSLPPGMLYLICPLKPFSCFKDEVMPLRVLEVFPHQSLQ